MNGVDAPILRKEFSAFGEIEYKIATTPQEMESALRLVYSQYLARKLIRPEDHKSEIRVGRQHLLPETRIFIATKDNQVVLTLSTFVDSPLGLPIDTGYHDEAQQLRQQGRLISEAGYFAVRNIMFRKKNTLSFRREKLILMFMIFRMALQYGLLHTSVDDACIVTNPDPTRKSFKYFPLEIIGKEKNYGFDELHINPKPAIAKRVDLRHLRPLMGKRISLSSLKDTVFAMVLGSKLPDAVLKPRLQLTKDDLRYFFVEKSDILENLKPAELEYVLSRYQLSKADLLG